MTTFKSQIPTNRTIVSRMVPPPNNKISGSFIITQSNQVSDLRQPQRNPIRHYRRQLTGSNTPNILIQPAFDVPGNSIVKKDIDKDCPKCSDQDTLFFSEEINPNRFRECLKDCSGVQSHDPQLWKYTCCTPENNITRTANTNLSKKYSTSNREFLKRRCKTYQSNLYSQNTKCSRDCNNCNINNINNNGINNVRSTGNINNAIGAVSNSAFIFKRSFRDLNNNSIDSNGLCCQKESDKIINTDNYNVCRAQDYPNLSRRAILCNKKYPPNLSPFPNVSLPFTLSVQAGPLTIPLILWPLIVVNNTFNADLIPDNLRYTKVTYTDRYHLFEQNNSLVANHSHVHDGGYQLEVRSTDGNHVYNSLNLLQGNHHNLLNVYPLSELPSSGITYILDTHFQLLKINNRYMTVDDIPHQGNAVTDYYTTNVQVKDLNLNWTVKFYVDRFWLYVGLDSNKMPSLRIMLAMRDVKIVIDNVVYNHPHWLYENTTRIVRFHKPDTSYIS